MKDFEIENYLSEHQISSDVSIEKGSFIDTVNVKLEMEDWRGHIECNKLMEAIGYKSLGEKYIEESGEDAYTSTHVYIKQ